MFYGIGKVIFDFYGNSEARTKHAAIERLIKSLWKEHRLSAREVEDFDNPERGVLGLAVVAANESSARRRLAVAFQFIDAHSELRVVAEEDFFAAL